LTDIEAKQAKEYPELFPPTCIQPESDPVLDLNVEIMNALAELRVDTPLEIIIGQEEITQRVYAQLPYDNILAFNKGLRAKNPLGVIGVDAV
jgi:hypothetical protein